MPLKIHGYPGAISTQRVLTICHELALTYTFILIDFKTSAQKSPQYLALQPFGKVPLLEDDGFFVYESRAICRYLVAKFSCSGRRLMPEEREVEKYALFEQACSIEMSYFDGAVAGICFEKFFKPRRGVEQTDEVLVAKLTLSLERTLAAYETILSGQKFLAGDELTLADLYHLPYGTLIKKLGFAETFARYPHVDAWFDVLSGRESWIKTISGSKGP